MHLLSVFQDHNYWAAIGTDAAIAAASSFMLTWLVARFGRLEEETGNYWMPPGWVWSAVLLLYINWCVGLGFLCGHVAALILGWPVEPGTLLGFFFALLILVYGTRRKPRPPRRRKKRRRVIWQQLVQLPARH